MSDSLANDVPESTAISASAPVLISQANLAKGLGITNEKAAMWVDHLNDAMSLYDINNRNRIASFLAQIGHESGRLKYVAELWGPTPTQKRYEGRKDLGNTHPGDGSKYRGHGLIQVTGRHNHKKATERLRAKFPGMGVPDFEAEPLKLTEPKWAALSAGDFWESINGNHYADEQAFTALTKKINGGTNGLEDRKKLWNGFLKILA